MLERRKRRQPPTILRMALVVRPHPTNKKDILMFNIHREVIDWAGRKLVLETGKIARQADGAVLATYGETTVLATVVSAKAPKPGVDFFPLTVN